MLNHPIIIPKVLKDKLDQFALIDKEIGEFNIKDGHRFIADERMPLIKKVKEKGNGKKSKY